MSPKSDKKNKNKAVDRKLVQRLYFFVKPYRWYIVLAIVLTLLSAFLGSVIPKLSQQAIDNYIAEGDTQGLRSIILLIVYALAGDFLLTVITTYITRWFGQGALYNLRVEVFNKIQSLHVQFFDKNPIGRLITRTTNDIEALSELLSSGVVTMIGDLLRIIFILYFMFGMNVKLTIISLAVLPMLFYLTFWFKSKVRVAFLEVRDQVARLNSFVQEHINGMDIVRLFNKQSTEFDKFKSINESHTQVQIKTIFYFAIFWPAVEMISSFAMALVVWYGGAQALSSELTVGILLAFIQYVRQFFRPIQQLSEKYNTLQSAFAASERIFGVLDESNKVANPSNPIEQEITNGEISFRDVWFKYNDNEDYVSKSLNFTVKPGETVAIVGATGAGKSTIINLLMRFYEFNKGEIQIDGFDIKKLNPTELRKKIALVLQDTILFSGTIFENITLNREDITKERVVEAAKLIGAHNFIEKLPNGYEHELKERGDSLSMGQRQLISFLRALVYDPTILVLDEATSNIDSETEALVNDACIKLVEGRTSIIIAHRLSTIQHADRIIVMHKGEIREMGSHQELLKNKDGIYKKLYELQFQESA
jgi:ATP-binding cassette subfamily B multidrug efflux pump